MPGDSERERVEEARLAALQALQALDGERDPVLEALVAEASEACDAPISLITLVTADLQWIKARRGIELQSTPRDQAFCAHTIQSDDGMLIPDAIEDPRFMYNPLVQGDPHIRSYAAAPLVITGGHKVGALCVIDTQPRDWTVRHQRTLQRLAIVAAHVLEAKVAASTTAALSKALSQSTIVERGFQAVFAGMAEGAVVQERDSTIIEANLSAERVLGLTRDQLLGRTSFDPRWQLTREDGSDLPPEEQPSMRCLATGRSVSDQLLGLKLPTGAFRWLRVNSQPFFKDGDATPFRTATTFVDVTAQLEAANQLARKSADLTMALKAAESANEAKSNFLANMSHEIRTPLNALIGTAAVMERTELTQSQREMVDLITTAGTNLEAILTDILDLAKIEADRLKLEEEPFELHAELAKVADIFAVQAAAKGISFSTSFGPDCSAVIVGDTKRIRQIIGNMLGNAVKFTETGSVELRVDFLDTTAGEQASGLYVEVQDTGIGIDPDALPRIFDRFSQADETITRRFGGTGLGLTISRTLAELMGGSIGALSLPGRGSTFTFYAPLRKSDLTGSLLNSLPALEWTTPSPLKVLVAEDNVANQKMMTLMLQALGAEIVLARDGADAVTKYENSDVDCILMDIHMPIKDGLTAISEIRQFEMSTGRPRTPIAIVTADSSAQRLSHALRVGADAELLKPITPQKLVECLAMLQELAATDSNTT